MVTRRKLLCDELLLPISFRKSAPSRIHTIFKIWSKISNLGLMAQLQGTL